MIRIGMLTSGGDCQALNAAMRGVAKTLYNSKEDVEIYGFLDGYQGLIYGRFRLLTYADFSGILTEGGTFLGSSRTPFKTIQEPGADGVEKRGALMTSLRAEPPREVGGIPVTAVRDYADGTETELTSGLRSEMELKGSDVLIYLLADGSKLAVRPSGTEPKIKMYVLVRGESREDCARKAEACAETARQLARRAD